MKISLILQGFTQPLPKDYKCKDKFLIVSLPCPDLEDTSKVGENWAQLEAKYKDQLLQKKLKVNFIIEDERDETRIDDISFANATQSAPITLSSDADTAKDLATADADVTSAGVADITTSVADTTSVAAGADNTTLESSDLQKELQSSTSKINALTEKLDSNEAQSEKIPVTAVAPTETVSGVSFPLAILLVVLALLLGWYIF